MVDGGAQLSDLPKKLKVYFDGACEPKNPGGWAVYGFIVRDADKNSVLKTGSGIAYVPGHKFATNNCAEYVALGYALKWLDEQEWRGRLEIFGDSQIVCYQLTGEYACKDEKLKSLRGRVMELLGKLCKAENDDALDMWSATWLKREENAAADALTRVAYERASGEKFPERSKKK
jgi:ribonuclease HI